MGPCSPIRGRVRADELPSARDPQSAPAHVGPAPVRDPAGRRDDDPAGRPERREHRAGSRAPDPRSRAGHAATRAAGPLRGRSASARSAPVRRAAADRRRCPGPVGRAEAAECSRSTSTCSGANAEYAARPLVAEPTGKDDVAPSAPPPPRDRPRLASRRQPSPRVRLRGRLRDLVPRSLSAPTPPGSTSWAARLAVAPGERTHFVLADLALDALTVRFDRIVCSRCSSMSPTRTPRSLHCTRCSDRAAWPGSARTFTAAHITSHHYATSPSYHLLSRTTSSASSSGVGACPSRVRAGSTA